METAFSLLLVFALVAAVGALGVLIAYFYNEVKHDADR
jgi:hypothetical protein